MLKRRLCFPIITSIMSVRVLVEPSNPTCPDSRYLIMMRVCRTHLSHVMLFPRKNYLQFQEKIRTYRTSICSPTRLAPATLNYHSQFLGAFSSSMPVPMLYSMPETHPTSPRLACPSVGPTASTSSGTQSTYHSELHLPNYSSTSHTRL